MHACASTVGSAIINTRLLGLCTGFNSYTQQRLNAATPTSSINIINHAILVLVVHCSVYIYLVTSD